jgi:cytochrome P450
MPSALQAIAWSKRPLPWLDRCRERYGDIFTLRIRYAGTWVLLSDPEHVKQVFTSNPGVLGVGVANTLLGPLLGQRSVMLLEEPEHMTRRKLMLPQFHGKRMESYRDMMDRVTREDVERWPIGEPFELWPRMQSITLEVIMRAVFGEEASGQPSKLRELLRGLTEWLNNPRRLSLLAVVGPRWIVRDPTFRAVMAPVEAAVLAEVRRRRADPNLEDRDDIVSMLAQAHYEDGSPMSEKDLRDELITLLSDGPTATLITWTFERLLRHPDKLARLREEVLADEEETYLDAVVKETMRLCPSVPIVVRRLVDPMEVGGYTLPAGTRVAPCPHLMHRREDVYPQPRRFVPERFLERPAGTYTWIPFGGGARRCIAASYAQLEMKRVIHTVLGEVELRAVESRSEQVQRSAIAFSPDRRGLVVASRPEPHLLRPDEQIVSRRAA